ncbi:hypothetical protein M9Y10_003375 [Tritrichomonas musculus]|uniref:DUF3447 domain-containing protein n=1 Tax=Tritrichomonas musculus TaxID=1915356 RepID=A0ABR2JPL3_9EUKA
MDSYDFQKQLIRKYIEEKKKSYNSLIEFLDNSEENDNDLQILEDALTTDEKEGNREEMYLFLETINSISTNHRRNPNFINKIVKILKKFEDRIKQSFSNIEIFNIFKNNKYILYFLIKNGLITFSEQVYQMILYQTESNGIRTCHFFYPECKQFMSEEENDDFQDSDMYEEKRLLGENDSYICKLIRQDLVEEFVSYVNRTNFSLMSEIKPSIFETNSFLIENNSMTLIEYSAFFGSIKIFKYLVMNKVRMTPSLWFFAIHSRNADMIHLLESYKIKPPFSNYTKCFIEAIKCHHNEIAEYFEQNFSDYFQCDQESIISNVLISHNYAYLPINFSESYEFFYLCSNNYYKIVDLFLKIKEDQIKLIIIFNHIFINGIFSNHFLMTF